MNLIGAGLPGAALAHAASEAVNGPEPARQGRERVPREAIDSKRGVVPSRGTAIPPLPYFNRS